MSTTRRSDAAQLPLFIDAMLSSPDSAAEIFDL